jgi:hypothetical protein
LRPCSATIQHVSPSSERPTGVRRGWPLLGSPSDSVVNRHRGGFAVVPAVAAAQMNDGASAVDRVVITGRRSCRGRRAAPIIGIKLDLANFQLISTSLLPLGRDIVSVEEANAMDVQQAVAIPDQR